MIFISEGYSNKAREGWEARVPSRQKEDAAKFAGMLIDMSLPRLAYEAEVEEEDEDHTLR